MSAATSDPRAEASSIAHDPTVVAEAAAVAPEAPKRRWSAWLATWLGPFIVFGFFLLLWEYMHRDGMRRFFDKPEFLVPSPVTVIDQAFLDPVVRSQMIRGLGWTSVSAGIGLGLAIVLGVLLAIIMSQAKWVEQATYPYLVAAQAIPVLAIVPLIYSVFGGGLGARVFVCVMISIFPIVTNTLFGLLSVDRGMHELFTLRDASRPTRLLKLQFPAALPSILTGFRISAGLSVIGAVVGEQFFRGGQMPGIGIIIEEFRQKGRYPQVYGGLIVACGLGIAVFLFFTWLSGRLVGHWYEEQHD